MATEGYIDTYKIVMVGDASVGKTNLLKKYQTGTLPKKQTPTIGVEFATKTVDLNETTKVKAQIWDTAGQERYRGILNLHFRRAVGALLVYDVTKEHTFNSIKKWMEDIKYCADPDVIIMLVGNKVDLVQGNTEAQNRKVPTDEAQQFARENKILFIETSALLGTNVADAFEQLLLEIHTLKMKTPVGTNQGEKPHILNSMQPQTSSNCCSC